MDRLSFHFVARSPTLTNLTDMSSMRCFFCGDKKTDLVFKVHVRRKDHAGETYDEIRQVGAHGECVKHHRNLTERMLKER